MVGIEERIRVSSVIVFPSRGTLTSQRTRTRFPLRSESARSSMDFLASSSKVGRTPKVAAEEMKLKNVSEKSRGITKERYQLSYLVFLHSIDPIHPQELTCRCESSGAGGSKSEKGSRENLHCIMCSKIRYYDNKYWRR